MPSLPCQIKISQNGGWQETLIHLMKKEEEKKAKISLKDLLKFYDKKDHVTSSSGKQKGSS